VVLGKKKREENSVGTRKKGPPKRLGINRIRRTRQVSVLSPSALVIKTEGGGEPVNDIKIGQKTKAHQGKRVGKKTIWVD